MWMSLYWSNAIVRLHIKVQVTHAYIFMWTQQTHIASVVDDHTSLWSYYICILMASFQTVIPIERIMGHPAKIKRCFDTQVQNGYSYIKKMYHIFNILINGCELQATWSRSVHSFKIWPCFISCQYTSV